MPWHSPTLEPGKYILNFKCPAIQTIKPLSLEGRNVFIITEWLGPGAVALCRGPCRKEQSPGGLVLVIGYSSFI